MRWRRTAISKTEGNSFPSSVSICTLSGPEGDRDVDSACEAMEE
jgi:hypothetical protein